MVSHKHKFIFVHIGRTAGCSIERALCDDYCGDESTLTNNKWVLYKDYKSFLENSELAISMNTRSEIKALFGKKVYNEYLKFTVVRNPWQRMLSQFKKTEDKRNGMYFVDWVKKSFVSKDRNMNNRFYKPCMWWISDDNGNNEMDYIIRFENLDKDFSKLLSKIGIDDIKLNKVKMLPSWASRDDIDSQNYRDYYDNETRELIAINFKSDIEEFGYEF